MAQKSTEGRKPRSRKATSAQPPTVLETRKETIPAAKPSVSNLEEEIRLRAYELYLQRGGTPGYENQDWLVAEQEVRSRQMEHTQ